VKLSHEPYGIHEVRVALALHVYESRRLRHGGPIISNAREVPEPKPHTPTMSRILNTAGLVVVIPSPKREHVEENQFCSEVSNVVAISREVSGLDVLEVDGHTQGDHRAQ